MMSFEEAKRIALEICESKGEVINNCTEYGDAFVFGNTDSTAIGGIIPFAVMKKTGEAKRMNAYLDESIDSGDELATYAI